MAAEDGRFTVENARGEAAHAAHLAAAEAARAEPEPEPEPKAPAPEPARPPAPRSRLGASKAAS